jgi:enoyl-[acyl-carrier protein] reductase II
MIKSPVCELLGIEYPIFCGAMAYVTDAKLVAAVSDAGGFGVMASIGHTADSLRQEIRKAKEITTKPFGVNLMLMSPNVADVVKVVIEEKVAGVTTGAGNPLPYMPALKEAGVKVFPVIPNVKLARRMAENGADGLVAEGMEAGGHIGEMTTLPLLPQVADAVSIPVLAAGGIADGRGLAAALMLGACGIQMGTRFMVAKECWIHQNAKQRIIDAVDTDTVHIGRTTGTRCGL